MKTRISKSCLLIALLICLSCLLAGCTFSIRMPAYHNSVPEIGTGPTQPVGDLPEDLPQSILEMYLLDSVSIIGTGDGFLRYSSTSPAAAVNCYDSSGIYQWRNTYLSDLQGLSITSLITLPDGGFAFLADNFDAFSYELEPFLFYLVSCDAQGNMRWQYAFESPCPNFGVSDLFVTESGDLLVVWTRSDEKDYSDSEGENPGLINAVDTNLCLTKFNPNGKVIAEKSYGGSDAEFVNGAAYDDKTGLVLNLSSYSADGEFTGKDKTGPRVVFFDENLDMKWQEFDILNSESPHSVCILDGDIYAVGRHIVQTGINVWSELRALEKIKPSGSMDWIQTSDIPYDRFNSTFTGCYPLPAANKVLTVADSRAMLYGANGQCYKEIPLEATPYSPHDVLIRDDEWILVEYRTYESSSSSLEDSFQRELVFSGYDFDGNLIWRRGFDS